MSAHPNSAVASPSSSPSYGMTDSELTSFVVFCFANEKLLFRYPQENPFVIYAAPTATVSGNQAPGSVSSKAATGGVHLSSTTATASAAPSTSPGSGLGVAAAGGTSRNSSNEMQPRGAGGSNPTSASNNNNNTTSMVSGAGRSTFASSIGSPTSAASPIGGLPHAKSALLLDGFGSSITGNHSSGGGAVPGTPGLQRDASAWNTNPNSGAGASSGGAHNTATRSRMQQLRHAKSTISLSDGISDAGLSSHTTSGAGAYPSGREELAAPGPGAGLPQASGGSVSRRLRRYAPSPVGHLNTIGGGNATVTAFAGMPHSGNAATTSNTGGGAVLAGGSGYTTNAENAAAYENIRLRLKVEAEEAEEAHNCVGIPAATLAHLVRSFTSSTSIQVDNVLFFVFPLPLEPASSARHATEETSKYSPRRRREKDKHRTSRRKGKKKGHQQRFCLRSGEEDGLEEEDEEEQAAADEDDEDAFSPDGSPEGSVSSFTSVLSGSMTTASGSSSISSSSVFSSSSTESSFDSADIGEMDSTSSCGSSSSLGSSSTSGKRSDDGGGSSVTATVSSSSTTSDAESNQGEIEGEGFSEEEEEERDEDDEDDETDNPGKSSSAVRKHIQSRKQKKISNNTKSSAGGGTGRRTGHAMLLIATDDVDTDDDALTKFLQCFVNAWMREERRSQYVSSQLSKVERLIEKWRHRLHRVDQQGPTNPTVGTGGGYTSSSAAAAASNAAPLAKSSQGDARQRVSSSSHLISGASGSPSSRAAGVANTISNSGGSAMTAARRAQKSVVLSSGALSGTTIVNAAGARAVLTQAGGNALSHPSSSVSSMSSTPSSSSSQHRHGESSNTRRTRPKRSSAHLIASQHPNGPDGNRPPPPPQRRRERDSPALHHGRSVAPENVTANYRPAEEVASLSKPRKKMFEWILNHHHLTLPSEMVTLLRIINYWNTNLRHIPPSKLKLLLSNNNGPAAPTNTTGADTHRHRRRHHPRDAEMVNASRHGHGYHLLPDFIFVNKVIRLPLTYLTGAPPPSKSPLLFNSQFDPRCGVRLVDVHFPERLHDEYVSLVGPYSPLLPLDEARTCFQSLQHPRSLGALYRGLQMLLWTKMAQRHAQLYLQKQALIGGATSPSSSTSSSVSGTSSSLSTHACYQAVAEEAATTDFLVLGLIEFLRMRRVLQVDSLITVTLTHADVLPASVVAANFQKRLNKVEAIISAMLTTVSQHQQRRSSPTTTTTTSTTLNSAVTLTESPPKAAGRSPLTTHTGGAAYAEADPHRHKLDVSRGRNASSLAPPLRPLPPLGAPSQLVLEMSMGLHQPLYPAPPPSGAMTFGRPTAANTAVSSPGTPIGNHGGSSSAAPIPSRVAHSSPHGTVVSSPSPSLNLQQGAGQQFRLVGGTASSAMHSMLCSPTSSSVAASHAPVVIPSMSSSVLTSNAAAVGEFLNTVAGMPATPGGATSSTHYTSAPGTIYSSNAMIGGTPPTMTPVVSPPTVFSSLSDPAAPSALRQSGGGAGAGAGSAAGQQPPSGSTPPTGRLRQPSQPSPPLTIGPAGAGRQYSGTQSRGGATTHGFGGSSSPQNPFHAPSGSRVLSLTVPCVWGTACPLCENLLQHPTWWNVGAGGGIAASPPNAMERRSSFVSSPSDGAMGSVLPSPTSKSRPYSTPADDTTASAADGFGGSAGRVKLRFPSLDPHVHHFNDPQLVYPPTHGGATGSSGSIVYPTVDFGSTGNSNFFKCNDISEEEDERLAAMRPWFLKPELYVRRDAKHAVSAYRVYQRLCGCAAEDLLPDDGEEDEKKTGSIVRSAGGFPTRRRKPSNNNIRSPSYANDGPLAAFPSSYSVDQEVWSSQAQSAPFSSPSASATFFPSCSGTKSPKLSAAGASWRLQRSSSRNRFQPAITVQHGAPSASVVAPGHYTWDQGGLLTTAMVPLEATVWLKQFAPIITERLELGVEQAAIIANTAAALRYAEAALVACQNEKEPSLKMAAGNPVPPLGNDQPPNEATTASVPAAVNQNGATPSQVPLETTTTTEFAASDVKKVEAQHSEPAEESAPPPTPPTTIMRTFTAPPTTAPVSAGTVSPVSPFMFTRHSSLETPITTGTTRMPTSSVAPTTTLSTTSLSVGALVRHSESKRIMTSGRGGVGDQVGRPITTSSSLPSGSSVGQPAQSSGVSSFYSPTSVPAPPPEAIGKMEMTSPISHNDGWRRVAEHGVAQGTHGLSCPDSKVRKSLFNDPAAGITNGEENRVNKKSILDHPPLPTSPRSIADVGFARTAATTGVDAVGLDSVLMPERLVSRSAGMLPPPPPSVSSQDEVESLLKDGEPPITRYTRRKLNDRSKYMPTVVGQQSFVLFTSPLTSLPPEKAPHIVVNVTPTHSNLNGESTEKQLKTEKLKSNEKGGEDIEAQGLKGDGKGGQMSVALGSQKNHRQEAPRGEKRIMEPNDDVQRYRRNTPDSTSVHSPTFSAGGRLKSVLRYLHPYPCGGAQFFKMSSAAVIQELPMHVLLQFVMHHLIVFLWTSKSQSDDSLYGTCGDAAGMMTGMNNLLVSAPPPTLGGLQRNVWVSGSDLNMVSGAYGVSSYGSATTSSRVQPHCGVDVEAILRQLERNLRRLPVFLARLLTVRDQASKGWSSQRLKKALRDQQRQAMNPSMPATTSLLVPQGSTGIAERSSASLPGFAASDCTVTGVFLSVPLEASPNAASMGEEREDASGPSNKKAENSAAGWNWVLEPGATSTTEDIGRTDQQECSNTRSPLLYTRSENTCKPTPGAEALKEPPSFTAGKRPFSTPLTRIDVSNHHFNSTMDNNVKSTTLNGSLMETVSLLDVQLMEAYELYDKMALMPLLMPYAGCRVGFPSMSPIGWPALLSPPQGGGVGNGGAAAGGTHIQHSYGVGTGALPSSPPTQSFQYSPTAANHSPAGPAPRSLTVPSVRLLLHTVVNEFSDVFLVGGQPCLDN